MTRKLLARISLLALLVVGVLAVAGPASATAPSGDASHLYILSNNSRSQYGRPWLGWDQNLANSAQAYANYMASSGDFRHDPNLHANAAAAVPGLMSWGENIAYISSGSNAIPAMHNNYMGSTGHRDNILGTQYDRIGIGIAYGGGRTYSVVRFATSSNKSALGKSVGVFESASSPSVNRIKVTGWALDPDSTGSSVIDVRVDGTVVATQSANVSRTDIGAAYKGFGNNHGFSVTAATIGGATKSVCVDVRNLAGYGGTVSLGCKNVAVTPDLSGPFYDVSSTHPFQTEIAWLERKGITGGFSDGTFRPNETVTREALAAFLWRYMGKPDPAPNAPRFSDVPTTHAFYTAIRWLAGEGITSGFSDGTFRGRDPVTRQAAASFLWKLAEKPAAAGNAPRFTDVSPSHPFYGAIRWLAGAKITTGNADGSFRPAGTLTRQAIAAFLYRFDRL